MASKVTHPCLTCHLPDCDDTSPRCPLRRAYAELQRYRYCNQAVPEDVRIRGNLAFREILIDSEARTSERNGGLSS